MYKTKILKYILFALLILPVCVEAIVIDSIQKEELIKQGIFKLNTLKESNLKKIQEGKTNELNFIVNLEPDNSIDYTTDYTVGGKGNFLSSPTIEQELNSRLQQVYTAKQKECYLILINAFDVKINAPIPVGLTAQDVFNTGKFFNEQSDIEQQKLFHNDVVTQISNNSIPTNRNSYILSCGAYCGAFFNNKVGCLLYWYSLQKADINNPAVPYYPETYDYLTTYLKNSNDFHKVSSKDNIAKQMVSAFENAAINVELKALILQKFTSAEIIDILKQFPSNDDYTTLSVAERLHVLSVFVSENMTGNYHTIGEEGYALKVIRNTPANDIELLLQGLEEVSVLNTNPNYTGDKSNTSALIYRLIAHIDDSWFGVGGDNYANLIKIVSGLIKKSPTFIDKQNEIYNADNINQRVYSWDESYNDFYPPVGATGYQIVLNSNATVGITKKYVSDYTLQPSGGEEGFTQAAPTFTAIGAPYNLHSFDLILFVNNCKLDMIEQAGVSKGDISFVPALFLKYAEDKQFNQTMFNAAVATADVVTIAAAPLSIVKAVTWTRRAWIAFETANAIGNLSMTVFGDDLPAEYQDVVNYSNYLMLAVGGKNILKGGYSSIKSAYTATIDITSGINKQAIILFAQKIKPQLLNLQQLSQQGKQSAVAITKFYERIKIEFKRVLNEDLEMLAVNNLGNIVEASQNLISITWSKNVKGLLSPTDAITFWNNTSKNFKHYLNNDLYIKYDDISGNLLFGNVSTKEIYGFYEGQMNIGIINGLGGLDKVLPFLKEVHGISGSQSVISLSNGIKLYRNSDKTTIALGSFAEGTQELLETELKFLKGSDFGSGKGRIQVLNIDDGVVVANGNWTQFRQKFNFPFLDSGIQDFTNYEFAFVTQPKLQNLFKNNFSELTGFGEEIKYLLENGITSVKFNGELKTIKSIIENSPDLKDKLLGSGIFSGQNKYINIDNW